MSLFPDGLDVLTSSVNNILCEAINKLELKVGIDGSADTDSIDYKIASIVLNYLLKSSFSGLTKISVGTTEPISPNVGDLWVDTN